MAGHVIDVVEPAPALIARLRADGFELSVQGDRLRIRPVDRVTAELRGLLERRKPELVALLEPVTEYVTLRQGPTLPAPAVRLAFTLEDRGFRVRLDPQHYVRVEPAEALTNRDRAAIARWALHLAAIVEYQPPEVQ